MAPYPAGVYHFNTNPVEEKERAAEATLYGLGPTSALGLLSSRALYSGQTDIGDVANLYNIFGSFSYSLTFARRYGYPFSTLELMTPQT
jgi:hypothetical protein